jgi:predicted negative regulator of RcsB-dependent stress response
VSEHLTDEEQVEKVKAWLKENGMSIVAGVVIALGGIFGLQYWRGYEADTAAKGADAYDRFMTEAGSADIAKTSSALDALREQHDGTVYIGYAALELARLQVNAGDLDAARATLEKAKQEKSDPALVSVIDLRLARVLMAQEKYSDADALLAGVKGESYAAEVASLRGQIAYRQGNMEAALAALKEAQEKGARDEIIKYLLEELQEQT